MNNFFNGEEALEIACEIERNGSEFYRRAASMVQLQESKDLLLELAIMEDGHETVFESMKDDMDKYGGFDADTDGTAVKYLQAVASNHVFLTNTSVWDVFKQDTDPRDVLRIALQAEFASIAFFQELIKQMPRGMNVNKLEDILLEEQEHVVIINKKIMAM